MKIENWFCSVETEAINFTEKSKISLVDVTKRVLDSRIIENLYL